MGGAEKERITESTSQCMEQGGAAASHSLSLFFACLPCRTEQLLDP